jgi:hypothetical protein
MRLFFLALGTIVLVVVLASAVAANEAKPAELKLAAAFQLPQLPGLSGPSADWRQYIRKGKEITPLASATGDVGLMQVNRNTWRGVYDVRGLGGDIAYNGNAGGEILLYYLTRYAIRKNEDKQPGRNLARATYSGTKPLDALSRSQAQPGAEKSR